MGSPLNIFRQASIFAVLIWFLSPGPGVLEAGPIRIESAELPQLSTGASGFSASSSERHGPLYYQQSRVVMIVLDGVRTEEFFRGSILAGRRWARPAAKLMPFIYETLIGEQKAMVLGNRFLNRGRGHRCVVNNNRFISLPGYADLLGARSQPNVKSNTFRGTVAYPTLVDRLLDQGLAPEEVAVFASWQHIQNVVSQTNHPDLHIDVGPRPGARRPPWSDARYDADLMSSIDEYLDGDSSKLRFLFVSFNDTDEWAHKRKYGNYIRALTRQDDYIRRIYTRLEARPAFRGRTTYIITTDHGRGVGRRWAHHGRFPGSQYIWAVVKAPRPLFVSRREFLGWQYRLFAACSHASLGLFSYRLLDSNSARAVAIGKKSGLR